MTLALGACSGESDEPIRVEGLPTPTSSTAPPAAGESAAAALQPLPAGTATGSVLVTYEGLGELRAPFTGECTAGTETLRLDGRADTAEIRLDATPDGVRLTMDDVGLSATSDVATGRYEVSGRHLSLAAPLVHDGGSTGRVELEVDCGG